MRRSAGQGQSASLIAGDVDGHSTAGRPASCPAWGDGGERDTSAASTHTLNFIFTFIYFIFMGMAGIGALDAVWA
jgi:hypothetical protein